MVNFIGPTQENEAIQVKRNLVKNLYDIISNISIILKIKLIKLENKGKVWMLLNTSSLTFHQK